MDKVKQILIVEDNEINREILKEILHDDYSLLFAENGQEGLEMLRAHNDSIDVMLLDLEMPVMGGHEVLSIKVKNPLIKDIPVIITTGTNTTEEEIKCLKLGATDFVGKPYDPVVVRLRINNIISLRESTEANRQKTLFIQNISHEIRTPMNAIMGFSQFLSTPGIGLEEEETHEYLGQITSHSRVLMGMIDDMLYLSNFDSGMTSLQAHDVLLNELCQGVLDSTEYCFPEGVNVAFTSDFDDSYEIKTNAKLLQQALGNLITNACKFTAEGEIMVHCALSDKQGNIKISVTDTGIGVPADQAEFIFERFAKIDDFIPGMGLGLCVTRKIAEHLNGRAYLDTAYNGGARFVMELPE